MEEDLDWLKALLIEHGGAELVIAIERAAREEMPPLDARSEMKIIFDELDALLVHGFKTVSYTMHMLKAKTLGIRQDLATIDLDNDTLIRASREGAESIIFSQDSLGEWGQLASEADIILREMRERYDLV